MNHLEILGVHDNFNYVFYGKVEDKLVSAYKRMSQEIINNGHGLSVDGNLSGGILLEDNENVIAGIFFHIKYETTLFVPTSFVNSEYRQQGIYIKLAEFLDQVARNYNMKDILAYFHVDNTTMIDIAITKIGYKPVLTLMSRPVIYKKDT